jgi:LysR family transcriptional activator of nhaA
MRLAVGVADALPKLVVRRLMQPVIDEPRLRLLCHEGDFDDALALYRLNVATRTCGCSATRWASPPYVGTGRLSSRVGRTTRLSRLARARAVAAADSPSGAALAPGFMARKQRGVLGRIAGEFEDSALLKSFAADGLSVFPAADWLRRDLERHYGVQRVGGCEGVQERFFVSF